MFLLAKNRMKKLFIFLFIINIIYCSGQEELKICSFNIQFLGHFKNKENKTLAKFLNPYDIVVIQEMVAPPSNGMYSDKTPYKKDIESLCNNRTLKTENGCDICMDPDCGYSKCDK